MIEFADIADYLDGFLTMLLEITSSCLTMSGPDGKVIA